MYFAPTTYHHLRKLVLSSLFLSLFHGLNAQTRYNLVVNPSFEVIERDTCIFRGVASINECLGWRGNALMAYNQFGQISYWGSPDAYNTEMCTVYVGAKVPSTFSGYQWPRSGNGYGGFIYRNPAREYITGTLSKPLQIDSTYTMEFFVSLAETYSTEYTKNLQVLFHSDSIVGIRPFSYLPGGMQTFPEEFYDTTKYYEILTDYLNDTLNWTMIKYHFTAKSNHRFFTIGNFTSPSFSHFLALKDNPFSYQRTYYYLDDVAVFLSSDTIPPPEPVFAFDVKAYPNPASEWFNFEYTLPVAGKVRLHITDVFGKMVLARTELAGQKGINTLPIDVNAWAMGQYHISVLYEGNGRSEYKHLKMQVVR